MSPQYNTLGARVPQVSRDGTDLLNGLLTYDPAKRLTAQQALNHTHFAVAPLPKEEQLMPTFPAVHAHTSASSSSATAAAAAAGTAGASTGSSFGGSALGTGIVAGSTAGLSGAAAAALAANKGKRLAAAADMRGGEFGGAMKRQR
jgi:serine/threonine protein kinase